MPVELTSAIAFLIGALVAMIASVQSVSKAAQLQQEILKRGAAAQGRVLRIWRPPLFGAFTRVYFEFQHTAGQVLTCHVDQRRGESTASLPAVGTWVGIRYLPERPTRAVIAKLVSRFVD
jgi:hypothetical protein